MGAAASSESALRLGVKDASGEDLTKVWQDLPAASQQCVRDALASLEKGAAASAGAEVDFAKQGLMIGELFSFFDRDRDRYWNRQEADHWGVVCFGSKPDDATWDGFLKMATEAPDGNDASMGLKLETMTWFYVRPDLKDMDISKHHAAVFSKVRMAEEIFDFFDQDKDGYWNHAESVKCMKATEGEDNEQPKEQFDELVKMVMPESEASKGISKNVVVEMYCHPVFSDFGLKLEKDLQKTNEYKAKLAEEIFDYFDADKDGYWNYEESCACNQATDPGHEKASEEAFKQMVSQIGEDASKGFSKKCIVEMYKTPSFNVHKDHACVLALKGK